MSYWSNQVTGASVPKYGVASLTRMVWQTSQTLDGRRLDPLGTDFAVQSEQKMRPQCRQ